MKSTRRMLAAAGLVAALLFATGAKATVVDWTVAALTTGDVPNPFIVDRNPPDDPGFGFAAALDLQSSIIDPTITTAAASLVLGSVSSSERASGFAFATIDPGGFNNSSVGSASEVSTVNTLSDGCLCMFDTATGALAATLSNPLGGGATVDLMLHVEGSLFLHDPGGTNGVSPDPSCDAIDPAECALLSDAGASVSVLLALADVIFTDPEAPPFVPLFNASATLEFQMIEGVLNPVLVGEGDWAFAELGDGVFSVDGPCNRFSCKIHVDLTVEFTNVQELFGFGDEVEVGLLVLTSAHGLSGQLLRVAADFANTASVEVTFVPQQVPAPASLLLLAAGLLGMCAARRRRTIH